MLNVKRLASINGILGLFFLNNSSNSFELSRPTTLYPRDTNSFVNIPSPHPASNRRRLVSDFINDVRLHISSFSIL